MEDRMRRTRTATPGRGYGRPTSREPEPRPGGLAVALVTLLLFAILGGSLWWGLAHELPTEAERRPTATIRHDSLAPTYTYDGEVIRWYVLVDPDTSVQYLVNDRGGTCPRLDKYGNVIGVETWKNEE